MSALHLKQLGQADWDLIADEVFGELDAADEAALERLDPAARARAREELEQAAGALAAALAEGENAKLPTVVAERVTERCVRMNGGGASAGGTGAAPMAMRGDGAARGPSVIGRIGPWMVAAAACIVAVFAVWPSGNVSPRTQLAMLRANASDALEVSWADWSLNGEPPAIAGVAGEVVWSDEEQAGVLHFAGLPPCGEGQRYQLWIVDAERGFEQRISGAIFDGGKGELYVPVKPQIPVHKAAAFAVTIEDDDGTWVSDMSRRVVIAMVK